MYTSFKYFNCTRCVAGGLTVSDNQRRFEVAYKLHIPCIKIDFSFWEEKLLYSYVCT